MSVFPMMLDGSRFSALVVGGGAVALRKTRALLDGGVRVTVVAPDMNGQLTDLAARDTRLTLVRARYEPTHIGDATIVVAATDDAVVNAGIAADALRFHRLVNVVDNPESGNFATAAVHRAGDLTVAVSAGGVPAAAGAIRDSIADRFDNRYAQAIAGLRGVRERLLAQGRGDAWKSISTEVLAEGFCEGVETGTIEARVDSWR